MSDREAGELLTAALVALDAKPAFVIDEDGVSMVLSTEATGQTLVEGMLALAVTDFLTGSLAPRLRSCQAPRCVRYFVQEHGRQQWCKASCGNRARAARFAERHR
jgi:predicted RNA-binding Zn ribbon-like protein